MRVFATRRRRSRGDGALIARSRDGAGQRRPVHGPGPQEPVYGPGPQEPVYGPGPQEPLFAGEAAPPPDGGWREEVRSAATLNLVAGIWLIIAPWVLGYSSQDPRWNNVVFGAIVACVGLIRLSGAYRASWLSWLNAAIGVWLFIAAFTIDSSGTASGNDIILGVIVFVLSFWSASASETRASLERPAEPYPAPRSRARLEGRTRRGGRARRGVDGRPRLPH